MTEPSQAFLDSCRNAKPKLPKAKCPACPLIDCTGLCDEARGNMDYYVYLVAQRRAGRGPTDAELASVVTDQSDLWLAHSTGQP